MTLSVGLVGPVGLAKANKDYQVILILGSMEKTDLTILDSRSGTEKIQIITEKINEKYNKKLIYHHADGLGNPKVREQKKRN
jgi:hypothetical protein